MKNLAKITLNADSAESDQPRTAVPSGRLLSFLFRPAARALAVLLVPMLFVACPAANDSSSGFRLDANLAASFELNGANSTEDLVPREHSVQVNWDNPRILVIVNNQTIDISVFSFEIRRLDASNAATSPGELTFTGPGGSANIEPDGFIYRITGETLSTLGLRVTGSMNSVANELTIRGLEAGDYDMRLISIIYTNGESSRQAPDSERRRFQVIDPAAPSFAVNTAAADETAFVISYPAVVHSEDINATVSWDNPAAYTYAGSATPIANITGFSFSAMVNGGVDETLARVLNAAVMQQLSEDGSLTPTARAFGAAVSLVNLPNFPMGFIELTLTISYESAMGVPALTPNTPRTTTVGQVSFDLSNPDNDAFANYVDVDDDDDGLIELRSAAELNMMRNELQGTRLDPDADDSGDGNLGSTDGCPASGCSGYELLVDVDLNSLEADTARANWVPLDGFATTFDGNNRAISNLRIRIGSPDAANGVGFFGDVVANNEIRNLHLAGVSIEDTDSEVLPTNLELTNVGALIGQAAAGVMVSNVLAEVENIGTSQQPTGTNVGGLIGRFEGTSSNSGRIENSAVLANSIVARAANVGGLVGSMGDLIEVNATAALVANITSEEGDNIGGLMGEVGPVQVYNSYAVTGSITGNAAVAGLIGEVALGTTIINSLALSRQLAARVAAAADLQPLVAGETIPINIANSYFNVTTYVNLTATGNVVIDAGALDTTRRGEGVEVSAVLTATNEGLAMDTPEPDNVYVGWIEDNCPAGTPVIWDFGTNAEYPAIACFGELFTVTQQREQINLVLLGMQPTIPLAVPEQ